MARYKDYNYEQSKMIPISFREQILPGTFEHTLSYLIDHELDVSIFDQRYNAPGPQVKIFSTCTWLHSLKARSLSSLR